MIRPRKLRVAIDAKFDLTPPEERTTQRRRRNFFIGLAVAVALLVGLSLLARPTRRAIKGWQARRIASQAFVLIDKGEWNEAIQKARDAQSLSYDEPETWRAVARLLSRTNQSVTALEWWKKLDAAGKLTIEDRRDYATAALFADDLSDAGAQVEILTSSTAHPACTDILLAAQLAVRRQDGTRALELAMRVWSDPAAQPNEVFSAAVLVMSFTKPGSPPYTEALSQIAKLARDPANSMSLDALTFLARQRIATGALPPNLSAAELASTLESHPRAQPPEILLASSVRVQEEPDRREEYVAQAMQRFGGGDDDVVAALAAWLRAAGRYENVLEVLPITRAARRRDLALLHLEALIGLSRWPEVKALLADERLPLPSFVQHMYLAAARAKLGETVGAENEWRRALEAADAPDKLLAVGSYAEQNSAIEIAQAAYDAAIKAAPRTRAAYQAALRVARQRDDTRRAQQIAAATLAQWPEDVATRRQETYLRLLLGATGPEAEAAELEARAFVAQEPSNWEGRAMLALARIRLGRWDAAMEAFSGLRATGIEPPAALAIRAAALAATGRLEGAVNDARNLATAHLLPEERALIAHLTEVPR